MQFEIALELYESLSQILPAFRFKNCKFSSKNDGGKLLDNITCKAAAVSNATVGLTSLLLRKNSKKRSQLSIKIYTQRIKFYVNLKHADIKETYYLFFYSFLSSTPIPGEGYCINKKKKKLRKKAQQFKQMEIYTEKVK